MGEWRDAGEGLVLTVLASSGYLVLSAVLGFSGAVKLRRPLAFAAAIGSYRILPRVVARPAAVAIALAEVGCAVLLAAPWTRLAGVAVAGGLVGAFLAAMLLALARGQRIGCGCFGAAGDLDVVGPSSVLRAVLLEAIVAGSALARRAAAPAFGVQVLVAALMLVLVFLLTENARLLPGRPAPATAAAGDRA
jgi:Methylamine utilisation protein MauE